MCIIVVYRLQIWNEVAGCQVGKHKKTGFLCSRHFDRRCFTNDSRQKLVPEAVPSKTAWCSSESETSNTPLLTSPLVSGPSHISTTALSSESLHITTPSLSSEPSHISSSPLSSAPVVSNFFPSPLPTASPTFHDPATGQPSTSTPKPFKPIQLFSPLQSTSNFSESNSLLAVPLDSSVSFNKDLLAGDNVDITSASTSEAERKPRSSVLSKINVSRVRVS